MRLSKRCTTSASESMALLTTIGANDEHRGDALPVHAIGVEAIGLFSSFYGFECEHTTSAFGGTTNGST
uniref:Uncharacterized protein n=1 Tax=Ralstonia solanacearum TaxID=305 RepID=A0A0S4WDX7_RALSL|nr:protein of unknown function [Ralstonia solanacearum]